METGLSDDSRIQIVSGIDDKAQVITSWSSSLKDQTDIKIVNNSLAKKSYSSPAVIKVEDNKQVKTNAIDVSRKEDTPAAEPEATAIMVEITDKLNIRRSPDKSGEKIDTVAKGTKLEKIADTDNGWTKINYNSQEAYVKSDYIKVIQ